MKIRNKSPYGALDVPLLRRELAAGETPDVTREQAALLLLQTDNFEPADDEATGTRDQVLEDLAQWHADNPTGVLDDGGTGFGVDPALAAAVDAATGEVAGADLQSMTVTQLGELAERRGVELAGVTRKADIIATIQGASA